MRIRNIERKFNRNEINKNKENKLESGLKPRNIHKEKLSHEIKLNEDQTSKLDRDNYIRPTHWREGIRDKVWENAKDEYGRVRDPVTGRYMSKNQPWHMGHKPGYEFHKHQKSAEKRGVSRKQFLDEYYNPEHYRPELPSSNVSHKGENVTDEYFGD